MMTDRTEQNNDDDADADDVWFILVDEVRDW